MPNWCYSFVSIQDSRKKIKKISRELEIALSKDLELINLLTHIGMTKDEVSNKSIRCRGYVVDWSVNDFGDEITMGIESAWTPHLEGVCKFVEAYSETAEIYYTAEEPGFELFWTNDPDMEGVVWVDSSFETNPDIELEYDDYWPKEAIERDLRKYFPEAKDWDDLCAKAIEYAESFDEDNFLRYREFDYVPIEECC